mgnify:CR=1 FL=1
MAGTRTNGPVGKPKGVGGLGRTAGPRQTIFGIFGTRLGRGWAILGLLGAAWGIMLTNVCNRDGVAGETTVVEPQIFGIGQFVPNATFLGILAKGASQKRKEQDQLAGTSEGVKASGELGKFQKSGKRRVVG